MPCYHGCGVCVMDRPWKYGVAEKRYLLSVGCWFIMLFLLVIGWGYISNMLVACIVLHLLNLFCMCFGYVPGSSKFGVSCFIVETILFSYNFLSVLQYIGVSFMEMLWGMNIHMLLMSFTFPIDTSLSPHFLLQFDGSKLKFWLFGVLWRCWLFA